MSHFSFGIDVISLYFQVFSQVSSHSCGLLRKHWLKIKQRKMSFLFGLPMNSCKLTVIFVESRNFLFIFNYVRIWFSLLVINFLTSHPSFLSFWVLLVGGIFFESQIFWYSFNSYLQCKSLGLPKCKRMTEAMINNAKCDEIYLSEDPVRDFGKAITQHHPTRTSLPKSPVGLTRTCTWNGSTSSSSSPYRQNGQRC